MKYKITVRFGAFRFSAECGSVAAAFRHVEAIVFSPMYTGTAEERENACDMYMTRLADMARGRAETIENSVFRVEAVREGMGA